ncbi:MAG TPA: hypothetical protein VGO61_20150 [Steroidobacteraceae bacterium]|jgi:hypothetical protein|nr:hypothetical protein [Steroidobacteraceae bacterium]
MKKFFTPLAVAVSSACLGLAAHAASAADAETAITIYSSAQPGAISPEFYRPIPGQGVPNAMSVPGYALVRDDRDVAIKQGRSQLSFTDVAALIDPTTVTFTSLTDPATRVLEQNFQFDLVSTQKLLLKFIDKQITVDKPNGNSVTSITGTLLSATDGIVLRGGDGSIYSIPSYASVRFPDLPGGLNTRPTLVWDIQSPSGGTHKSRVTYQTGGITWWADYNLIFNEGADANSGMLDLSAWVSVINQSGASYADAKLKLIAGDVNRVQSEMDSGMRREMLTMAANAPAKAGGFTQKDFFEFHLYTLGRKTTLPNNSTKQIELFDQARQIPAKKVLLYYGVLQPYFYPSPYTDRNMGVTTNKKVDVYLEFRNDKQYGLGVPLPAGRLRVSQLDKADGSLEFIGEDKIDHTPKDEQVRIKLGSAFDVVGERRQVSFSVDTTAKTMEEEIEVKLRNHKTLPVDVVVKENLYRWSNWTILTKTHPFVKQDARTISFPVKVAKDGETVVRYRVRYTW